ncbi:unnamed protein product [Gongylonema pulchrum]|uniref:TERF2-interacting telomeric protein 1 n=1 Tax=Gongylonema pulchrum TaxID=637853 RepID=A0A183E0Y8_9BILA|nr:unnamed protein product [Gongylonema pulchrum]
MGAEKSAETELAVLGTEGGESVSKEDSAVTELVQLMNKQKMLSSTDSNSWGQPPASLSTDPPAASLLIPFAPASECPDRLKPPAETMTPTQVLKKKIKLTPTSDSMELPAANDISEAASTVEPTAGAISESESTLDGARREHNGSNDSVSSGNINLAVSLPNSQSRPATGKGRRWPKKSRVAANLQFLRKQPENKK